MNKRDHQSKKNKRIIKITKMENEFIDVLNRDLFIELVTIKFILSRYHTILHEEIDHR